MASKEDLHVAFPIFLYKALLLLSLTLTLCQNASDGGQLPYSNKLWINSFYFSHLVSFHLSPQGYTPFLYFAYLYHKTSPTLMPQFMITKNLKVVNNVGALLFEILKL